VKLQKLLEDGPVVVKDAVEDLVETIGSIGDDTDDTKVNTVATAEE